MKVSKRKESPIDYHLRVLGGLTKEIGVKIRQWKRKQYASSNAYPPPITATKNAYKKWSKKYPRVVKDISEYLP